MTQVILPSGSVRFARPIGEWHMEESREMIRRRPIPRSQYRWRPRVKRQNLLRNELILDGAVMRMPDGREICQPNTRGRRLYAERVAAMVHGKTIVAPFAISASVSHWRHSSIRGGGERADQGVTTALSMKQAIG